MTPYAKLPNMTLYHGDSAIVLAEMPADRIDPPYDSLRSYNGFTFDFETIARDHILSWSNPGDTVLDPFLGSGTTLKMASLLDRKEAYCQRPATDPTGPLKKDAQTP
jgi:DNA modification methylase